MRLRGKRKTHVDNHPPHYHCNCWRLQAAGSWLMRKYQAECPARPTDEGGVEPRGPKALEFVGELWTSWRNV
eukprot:7231128-Pyramimonas_sp.AAC.1